MPVATSRRTTVPVSSVEARGNRNEYELSLDSGKDYSLAAFGLGGEQDAALAELRNLVGGSVVDKILLMDPQPMILKAVDILDETDPVAGVRTWLWGYWKFMVSETVLLTKLAPAMKGAPGYRGHLDSGSHEDAVLRTLWFGIDRMSNKLSAIIHVLPTDASLRAGIRNAAEYGNGALEREYRLSLAPRDLTFDKKDSNQIIDFGDAQQKKEISLDLVRFTGTKGARMKSPMMLSADTENKDLGRGGRKMEYTFASLDEMRNHEIVKLVVDQEVEKKLSALSADQQMKVLSGIPVETLLKHEAVKPLAARQTREEVVKSLSGDELKVALSKQENMQLAMEAVEKTLEDMEQIQAGALKCFAELGLPEKEASSLYLLMGQQIVAAKEPLVEAKRVGELRLSSMNGGTVPQKGRVGGEEAPKADAEGAGFSEASKEFRKRRGW